MAGGFLRWSVLLLFFLLLARMTQVVYVWCMADVLACTIFFRWGRGR